MLFYFFGNRLTPWADIAVILALIFGGRWLIVHFDFTRWRRRLAITALILLFFVLSPIGTQIVLTIGIYVFFLYAQVAGIHMT